MESFRNTEARSPSRRRRAIRVSPSSCPSTQPQKSRQREPSDGEAGHPDVGRRTAGPERDRPRSAGPLRQRLPRLEGKLADRRARHGGAAEGSERPSGAVPRRPADARDGRHGVPSRSAEALPRGPKGAAHGLRGHTRRDHRHQRHWARPLPDEAMEPTRTEPLPHSRRRARRLAGECSGPL